MQAKRNYRRASIRDDILRKLRLDAMPNVTSRRLPAIPQLQSIIDEMCQQRAASCAGAPAGVTGSSPVASTASSRQNGHDGGGTQAGSDDYDDDVRATTIKILLFPSARN